MVYLNQFNKATRDDGMRIYMNPEFVEKFVTTYSSQVSSLNELKLLAEDVETKKAISFEVCEWNRFVSRHVRCAAARTEIHMQVKNFFDKQLDKYFANLLEEEKEVIKPILKTKKVRVANPYKETKKDNQEIKELKAELKAEKKAHRETKKTNRKEVKTLTEQRDTYKAEALKMTGVAKQSMIAMLNIGKSVGIEITQQDLDL